MHLYCVQLNTNFLHLKLFLILAIIIDFLLLYNDAFIETCMKRDDKNLYSNQSKK